jgi:hypothetical protein
MAAEDCLNISAQLSRVVCGGPIAEQSRFGTIAVLGGGGGFKKLEAASLVPRAGRPFQNFPKNKFGNLTKKKHVGATP